MSTPMPPPAAPPTSAPPPLEAPPKRGVSCWVWGCLGCLGLTLLLVIVLILAARAGVHHVRDTFTEPAPTPLPARVVQPGDQEALRERMDAFQEAAGAGEATELRLTADDLNLMIADAKELKDKVHFEITEEDEIRVRVSWPLDDIVPFMGGRYFNGTMAVRMEVRGPGDIVVNMTELEVPGAPIPAEVMQQLSKENLARDVRNNPQFRELEKHVEAMRIEDGQLVIVTRQQASAQATAGDAVQEE